MSLAPIGSLLLLWNAAMAEPVDTAAAACGACHEQVYAEWRSSRHAVAATNAVFTASWEHWPNGWCLQCHAPDPAQQAARLGRPAVAGVIHTLPEAPPGPAWADGVDCAACHLREGQLLSAKPPTQLAQSVHPITADPRLGDERLCATCHEFPFQNHTPPWPFSYGTVMAQETISEWRTSQAAADGVTCQGCHMGRVGHRFPGAHSPGLLRDLVSVDVRRIEAGVYLAQLRAPGAAHRVPTGDPFRRLVLALCADPDCAEVLTEQTVRRVFTADDTSWAPYADRTLPPERPSQPSTLDLTVQVPGVARAWRLSYRYGDARFEADLPAHEVGYVIHSGLIPTP